MKLEEFKEKDGKKRIIYIGSSVIVLLLAVVLVIRSFALYEERKEFDVIKGKVPEYMSEYDVNLAVTIDGVSSTIIPEKSSGKRVSSIECDKDGSAYWDYNDWKIVIDFKNTRTKCKVNFVTKYTDATLNGTDPVLSGGLVPVIIDENGVVKKANEQESWYNYANKKWANAIILEDEREIYQNGEVIPEDKIESYFVWIPRYKYKIFNDGNYTGLTVVEKREQEIEIEFENKNTAISSGSTVGSWLTHPAFTSFDVNGMWVGKFETGYKNATTPEEAQANVADSSKVIVKPNVYSWRSIQVANAFIASYNYQRDIDSHMMKNTEWGAVAYLSHSKYGSMSRVRFNNNSSFMTGYSAKDEPTCGYTATNESCNIYDTPSSLGLDGTNTYNYFNNLSMSASTTGNRTGIYDMSGGSWEYVMGVMLDKNSQLVSGCNDNSNSNFIGSLVSSSSETKTDWTVVDGGIPYPAAKYYDTYVYTTDYQYFNLRVLGDATGEMGPFANATYGSRTSKIGSWYSDEAWFVYSASPWFVRGGMWSMGVGSGLFDFSCNCGRALASYSFRIVLTF